MYGIKATDTSCSNVHKIMKDGHALLQEANHSVCARKWDLHGRHRRRRDR
jgi:hypothetical protein